MNEPHGTATVDVTPSTRITQLTPAQLTDITTGQCVMVRPTKDSGGPPAVTAAVVVGLGSPGGACAGGHQHGKGLRGTVSSVTGNSMLVATPDNGQATVTVTSNTRYEKRSAADTSAITTGECLAARGTADASGTLQASAVNLRSANNGRCGRG